MYFSMLVIVKLYNEDSCNVGEYCKEYRVRDNNMENSTTSTSYITLGLTLTCLHEQEPAFLN